MPSADCPGFSRAARNHAPRGGGAGPPPRRCLGAELQHRQRDGRNRGLVLRRQSRAARAACSFLNRAPSPRLAPAVQARGGSAHTECPAAPQDGCGHGPVPDNWCARSLACPRRTALDVTPLSPVNAACPRRTALAATPLSPVNAMRSDATCEPVWTEFATRCDTDIQLSADAANMMQFTSLCRASVPAPCDGSSLLFEAYTPGDTFDWSSLAGIVDTVFDETWNGWDPIIQHRELGNDIWYDSADAIPLFTEREKFVIRFRGTITVPAAGEYQFKTRSDDGSMLYIDQQEVVNNDGAHGAQEVTSNPVTLTPGAHDITITFFENGGGEVLQVSWTPTPGAAFAPLSSSVLSNRVGCSCHR